MDNKTLLLVASLFLNATLVGGILWLGDRDRENELEAVAAGADEQIQMGERVLNDIASGDAARISDMTNSLFWQVDAQKRIRYKIRTHDM